MNKDKNYWKEYNAKRKEYLAQKARERRAKEKNKNIQPLEANNSYTTNLSIQPDQSDRIQLKESIQPSKEIKAYTTEHSKIIDINNSAYTTQEYNQALEKLKSQWATQEKGKCYSYRPEPITKLHYCNACDYHHHRNETKPWLKVQKPQPQQTIKPNSQLWSDYYSCKKPFCLNCQQLGIKETEYKFCSEYECVVKHWTIFQGKN